MWSAISRRIAGGTAEELSDVQHNQVDFKITAWHLGLPDTQVPFTGRCSFPNRFVQGDACVRARRMALAGQIRDLQAGCAAVHRQDDERERERSGVCRPGERSVEAVWKQLGPGVPG